MGRSRTPSFDRFDGVQTVVQTVAGLAANNSFSWDMLESKPNSPAAGNNDGRRAAPVRSNAPVSVQGCSLREVLSKTAPPDVRPGARVRSLTPPEGKGIGSSP